MDAAGSAIGLNTDVPPRSGIFHVSGRIGQLAAMQVISAARGFGSIHGIARQSVWRWLAGILNDFLRVGARNKKTSRVAERFF